ncbi:MAG: RHS repeat-associated core domain-containing protein [Fimbriimonas ginsengisoli]|uniref:RHS repeat-associated core domain-containing protein n=1 Tax=Fimbriimonas ginsengisoli TaxID=1005039 RepID=A0A931PSZ4_FIMGI|nr:RHS repeat-associated core domain-containing protein [Fimbriimonas ginsengisoli]
MRLASKTVDSAATANGYDAIDQLTSESSPGYSASYTYDANGNRLTKTLNGVADAYTYDSGDKMLTAGAKSFGYDAAGRRTSMVASGQTTTYAYDYEDRLTSVVVPGVGTNTFTYNGLDTRVGKVDSGGTKTFKRDGVGVTDPVLSDSAASYTPGVSERRSGVSKFTHSDRMGTNTKFTDATQSTTDTKTYDAFGVTTSSSGTSPTPFGYAGDYGYHEDADSSLKLLGHRYYDPSTGRFLTRDCAKHGRNWYRYARSSPVGYVDPSGLFHIEIRIGPNGEGTGALYADAGDVIGIDEKTDKPIYARGGEKLKVFPVSNHVPNPSADPSEIGAVGPFPDGTYPISRVEAPDDAHAAAMGDEYFQLTENPARDRGTWVHAGQGERWQAGTRGCVRVRQSDIDDLMVWYRLQKGMSRSRKSPRITVKHES